MYAPCLSHCYLSLTYLQSLEGVGGGERGGGVVARQKKFEGEKEFKFHATSDVLKVGEPRDKWLCRHRQNF